MSYNRALPYKPSNPRTIHGAVERGWHHIRIPEKHRFTNRETGNQLSWLGVEIWSTRHSNGHWVNYFGHTRQWAFELEEDASKFIFQWNLV